MIVVSDLGGALSAGSPVRGLVSWVRRNQSAFRANLYFASILPSYLLASRGLIDWNQWTESLMTSTLKIIHQATPEIFEEIAEICVEEQFWPQRRLDMIARLEEHIRQGDQVYIATGAWQPLAQGFAAKIGAQGIGTQLVFENGRVRLAEEIGHGKLKIRKVLEKLGVDRIDVAYGDTGADVYMLENAVTPVAVYPDDALRAVAEARGWEIVGD